MSGGGRHPERELERAKARQDAIARGSKTFQSSNLCLFGHSTRYVANGRCHDCIAVWTKNHAIANVDKRREVVHRIQGANREKYRALSRNSRYRHSKRIKERSAASRMRDPSINAASRARARDSIRRNPERHRIHNKNTKYIRRSAKRLGIKPTVLHDWCEAAPKECFYCGTSCGNDYHIDHSMPLSRGGAHVLTNLRIACIRCNTAKGARIRYAEVRC